jgi:hypothetical protein
MLPQYRFIVKTTKKYDKYWVYDLELKKKVSEKFLSFEEADKRKMELIQEVLNNDKKTEKTRGF